MESRLWLNLKKLLHRSCITLRATVTFSRRFHPSFRSIGLQPIYFFSQWVYSAGENKRWFDFQNETAFFAFYFDRYFIHKDSCRWRGLSFDSRNPIELRSFNEWNIFKCKWRQTGPAHNQGWHRTKGFKLLSRLNLHIDFSCQCSGQSELLLDIYPFIYPVKYSINQPYTISLQNFRWCSRLLPIPILFSSALLPKPSRLVSASKCRLENILAREFFCDRASMHQWKGSAMDICVTNRRVTSPWLLDI